MRSDDASPVPAAMRGPLAAAAVGASFLAWIAGVRLIDPTSIDWLMKGDWVPHQFGWHYFRIEPWHWPPGRVLGYHAPLGTSIGLTDSIPIAAYLLKPLSPWLPAEFQYLGLWLLLCFALQGALGARLVGRFSPSAVTQWLGGTLFVLLPTLLARVAHAALVAHWLVLWTLLIATRAADRRFQALEWTVLGLVAGMTQPYLAAMALPLLAAVALDARGAPWPRRARALGAAAAATIAGWWLSGLFVLQGEGALAEGGLGYFSMNLASFVVHGGWSRWMPAIPVAAEGQIYEGFHYLGAGLLGLVAVAVVLVASGAGVPRVPPLWSRWVRVVAAAMAIVALSPRVTLGPYVLVDLTGAWTAPLAMFRSSGRFVWPLTYLLLTWAIVTVDRRAAPRTSLGVLALAVLVQVADLGDAYRFRHDAARDPSFHAWTNPFASARWEAIVPSYRHLALVPPPQCGDAPGRAAPRDFERGRRRPCGCGGPAALLPRGGRGDRPSGSRRRHALPRLGAGRGHHRRHGRPAGGVRDDRRPVGLHDRRRAGALAGRHGLRHRTGPAGDSLTLHPDDAHLDRLLAVRAASRGNRRMSVLI